MPMHKYAKLLILPERTHCRFPDVHTSLSRHRCVPHLAGSQFPGQTFDLRRAPAATYLHLRHAASIQTARVPGGSAAGVLRPLQPARAAHRRHAAAAGGPGGQQTAGRRDPAAAAPHAPPQVLSAKQQWERLICEGGLLQSLWWACVPAVCLIRFALCP